MYRSWYRYGPVTKSKTYNSFLGPERRRPEPGARGADDLRRTAVLIHAVSLHSTAVTCSDANRTPRGQFHTKYVSHVCGGGGSLGGAHPTVEPRGVAGLAIVEPRGVAGLAIIEPRGVAGLAIVEPRGVAGRDTVDARGIAGLATVDQ